MADRLESSRRAKSSFQAKQQAVLQEFQLAFQALKELRWSDAELTKILKEVLSLVPHVEHAFPWTGAFLNVVQDPQPQPAVKAASGSRLYPRLEENVDLIRVGNDIRNYLENARIYPEQLNGPFVPEEDATLRLQEFFQVLFPIWESYFRAVQNHPVGELRRRHIHDFLERTANCVEDLKRLEAAQWLPSSFFQWCIGLPFALTAEFTSEMQQQTRVVAPIFDVFLELLPPATFRRDQEALGLFGVESGVGPYLRPDMQIVDMVRTAEEDFQISSFVGEVKPDSYNSFFRHPDCLKELSFMAASLKEQIFLRSYLLPSEAKARCAVLGCVIEKDYIYPLRLKISDFVASPAAPSNAVPIFHLERAPRIPIFKPSADDGSLQRTFVHLALFLSEVFHNASMQAIHGVSVRPLREDALVLLPSPAKSVSSRTSATRDLSPLNPLNFDPQPQTQHSVSSGTLQLKLSNYDVESVLDTSVSLLKAKPGIVGPATLVVKRCHPNEAALLQFFSTHGAVPVLDTLKTTESDYIDLVMPQLEAVPRERSLRSCLRHLGRVLHCLDQVHRFGFAHLDIKLSNLLFQDDQIYVGDFGCCLHLQGKPNILLRGFHGTAGHAPPELERFPFVASPKADIWSAAIAFFELLEPGYLARTRRDSTSVRNYVLTHICAFVPPGDEHLGTAVVDVLNQMLAEDFSQRPTAADLLRHPLFSLV